MKILQSIWFWIYTALSCWAGMVCIQNLDTAIEQRDWLFYGSCSLLYPVGIFVVGLFCGHQFSRVEARSPRIFHLAALTVVNLLLALWIFMQASISLVWFPYSLIVWGICLWASSSELSVKKVSGRYARFLGAVVLFLAPLITIFYVLMTGVDDARLAERQRLQDSRKEAVQLNARLINQSLEQLREGERGVAELKAQSIYILDETAREKQCSGKRSAKLSELLVDVRGNHREIESWFESEDLSAYSHSFLLFALREYEEQFSGIADHSQRKNRLPEFMEDLRNRLSFALTGDAAADYFVLDVGEEQVALTEQTIYAEIAEIENRNLKLTKETPPPFGWSERIPSLEGSVFLYHQPVKTISVAGLSHWFSVFCLSWLSMLMLGVLLYARHRDRIAREKLDIASTVAHEFRTPLTGMAVLIDHLLEEKQRDPEKVTSYLQKMKSSNQRLHQIAEHFFIEGALKQKNIKLETVHWSAWVNEQWEEFISLYPSERISFSNGIQSSEKTALLDTTLLSLALQNILRNAYHYTKKGSISIALAESSTQLGIEVKDTGIGMDASTLKSVFHKYSRGEDSLSRETEGLGLGLYLAMEIARLHDGEIAVESVLHQGSTFTLWISK